MILIPISAASFLFMSPIDTISYHNLSAKSLETVPFPLQAFHQIVISIDLSEYIKSYHSIGDLLATNMEERDIFSLSVKFHLSSIKVFLFMLNPEKVESFSNSFREKKW